MFVVLEQEFESEWEFYPFGEHDWHAVKQHCSRLLDGRVWDVGSLASLVCDGRRAVGSAIKIGARDSEALGVGAVLALGHCPASAGLAAARDYALAAFAQHATPDERSRAQKTLEHASVGLLVNERILNLPPLVALQLHLSMFEEMEAHQKQIGPASEYRLDYFLIVTVAYRESAGDSSGPQGAGKKLRDTQTQLEWFRPEEEIYMQHAFCSTVWPIAVQDQASRWTFDGRISQFKVVMLVPTSSIPAIAKKFIAINEGEYE